MVYVKHFDILGIDTAQIACIELQGVPTAATQGAVGVLGVDMTSGGYEVYICTKVEGAIHTWKCLKDGKDGTCVVSAYINPNNQIVLGLSNGTEITVVGNVKGEQGDPGQDGKDGVDGKDGTNGEDGKDGISVTKVELVNGEYLKFTFSDDTSTTLTDSIKGPPGDNGLNGTNGTNGTDYVLTDDDKDEIADIVIEKLPYYSGAVTLA